MTDFDDLSARARRQPLSSADSRELADSLDASADARLWHRVGTAFDAEDSVLPGDHDATERVLGRLLRELPVKEPRARRRIGVLLVAAALLVASVAAAAVLAIRQREIAASPRSSAGLTARAPASAWKAPGIALQAPPGPEPQPAAPSVEQPPLAPAPPPTSSEAAQSPSPESAAGLLSAAGRARRDGYAGQAITLLQSLQSRFPNSAEARASDITLGMLLLKNGSVSAARQHFERYLQRAPQGPLAADALWGRAQALSAQGNNAEARATLTTLLARYPSSAYASAARAKLRAP